MAITVSGTSIVFNDATTQTTAFTGGGGTVTSVATGNGLTGGTITSSGTLTVACPTFNTVGSYCFATVKIAQPTPDSNYAAGTGNNQMQALSMQQDCFVRFIKQNNLSGTWKWMAGSGSSSFGSLETSGIACRVS